jgi:hypothetical protein
MRIPCATQNKNGWCVARRSGGCSPRRQRRDPLSLWRVRVRSSAGTRTHTNDRDVRLLRGSGRRKRRRSSKRLQQSSRWLWTKRRNRGRFRLLGWKPEYDAVSWRSRGRRLVRWCLVGHRRRSGRGFSRG